MGEIPEEAIRMRAYHIWEREGRPDGRDREHWVQAQTELSAEVVRVAVPQRTAAAVAPPQASQARANGGKSVPAKPARSGTARPARAKR